MNSIEYDLMIQYSSSIKLGLKHAQIIQNFKQTVDLWEAYINNFETQPKVTMYQQELHAYNEIKACIQQAITHIFELQASYDALFKHQQVLGVHLTESHKLIQDYNTSIMQLQSIDEANSKHHQELQHNIQEYNLKYSVTHEVLETLEKLLPSPTQSVTKTHPQAIPQQPSSRWSTRMIWILLTGMMNSILTYFSFCYHFYFVFLFCSTLYSQLQLSSTKVGCSLLVSIIGYMVSYKFIDRHQAHISYRLLWTSAVLFLGCVLGLSQCSSIVEAIKVSFTTGLEQTIVMNPYLVYTYVVYFNKIALKQVLHLIGIPWYLRLFMQLYINFVASVLLREPTITPYYHLVRACITQADWKLVNLRDVFTYFRAIQYVASGITHAASLWVYWHKYFENLINIILTSPETMSLSEWYFTSIIIINIVDAWFNPCFEWVGTLGECMIQTVNWCYSWTCYTTSMIVRCITFAYEMCFKKQLLSEDLQYPQVVRHQLDALSHKVLLPT